MERHPTDRDSLERDCVVEFIRASGPGGQHRNKRETGVRLTHMPTSFMVTATERRSRTQNLEVAFMRMEAEIEEAQRVRKKRRPTRPTRGSQRRRLKAKKRRGEVKRLRGKPKYE